MKLLGSVMVMIASTGIGFLLASELQRRRKELMEQISLLKLMLGDIRYTRATLPEALKFAVRRHQGDYAVFLKEVAEQMELSPGIGPEQIWEKTAERVLKTNSLSKQDKHLFSKIGESFGFSEREQQIAAIELHINEIKEVVDGIDEVIAPKIKLYRSIGVLVGIFIIVFLL